MAHKCYISFKTEDVFYKKYIQDHLNVDMIDKSLNEPIDSEDPDYILRRIRSEYLSDSTVTLHLIGSFSAENLGKKEQLFIKRELQASLFNGRDSPRSGILGIVLPEIEDKIYTGAYVCVSCGNRHIGVNINDSTTIREFSCNYYIPNNKCSHTEDDRYCVLVSWTDFCQNPNDWIDAAFDKRCSEISKKVRVYPE